MKNTKPEDFLELERRVEDEVEKSREKDKLLFQQAKLASLGEMVGNISHQWRQPLMEINSIFLPIEAKISLEKKIESSEILEAIGKLNEITKFMSITIDDFREFFSNDKERVEFNLLEQINKTVNIISSTLKINDIKLEIILQKNPELCGYKNEYSQVLINIINNAKDELLIRKIENPHIKIEIFEKDDLVYTQIKDNAGGIKVNPIEKIFEPFFTYNKQNGSGIGLFMSKLIVEQNMYGKLSATNIDGGACFEIILPKN